MYQEFRQDYEMLYKKITAVEVFQAVDLSQGIGENRFLCKGNNIRVEVFSELCCNVPKTSFVALDLDLQTPGK